MNAFLVFARWAFEQGNLPNLKAIAYGDFTIEDPSPPGAYAGGYDWAREKKADQLILYRDVSRPTRRGFRFCATKKTDAVGLRDLEVDLGFLHTAAWSRSFFF